MIVHFAITYKVICNGTLTRKGGALYSRFHGNKAYNNFYKDVTWLFTTSDDVVNCPDCIKIRIAFHEKTIGKLRAKLPENT